MNLTIRAILLTYVRLPSLLLTGAIDLTCDFLLSFMPNKKRSTFSRQTITSYINIMTVKDDAVIIKYLAAAFLFHCVSPFSHLHKEKRCLRVGPRACRGFKSQRPNIVQTVLSFLLFFSMSRISRRVMSISSSRPLILGTGFSVGITTSVPVT